MKRLLCCLTLLICWLSTAPAAEPLTAPQRAELLARLQALHKKHPSFESTFSEQRTSRLLRKPLQCTGTIAFQVPDKFRREVTGAKPSLTVSNGRELWIYYPHFQQVEQYTLGQRALFDDALAALTAGLNYARVEEFFELAATPQDGGGYRLELTPKRSNIKKVVQRLTVILDRELSVRRTDLILPKGDEVVTTYAAPRREALPADTFEFVPPAGANVTHPLGK